jgi:hypothetical protein
MGMPHPSRRLPAPMHKTSHFRGPKKGHFRGSTWEPGFLWPPAAHNPAKNFWGSNRKPGTRKLGNWSCQQIEICKIADVLVSGFPVVEKQSQQHPGFSAMEGGRTGSDADNMIILLHLFKTPQSEIRQGSSQHQTELHFKEMQLDGIAVSTS